MSSKIASMSKLNFAASISRVRWTSATMVSSHMTLVSHKFFRCTDDWHLAAQLLTHHCYSPRDLCVCQVLAIPGKQIVNRVYRRHGNVCSVANDVRRKDTSSHDGLRQRIGVIGDRQSRQPFDDREPLLNFRRIADRGLVDDDLGDRAVKLATSIRPPFLCGLLVACDNYVATGTSDQVADERRFQVDRFHTDPSRRLRKLRLWSKVDSLA